MLFFRIIISFLRDKEYRDLIYTTLVVLIIGSASYHNLEGWTWIDSLYFCVVTLTTVGYGDFAPQTDGGKIFTIFYIIVGIGIILSFIDSVYHHFNMSSEDRRKRIRQRLRERNKE
ncbi:MAG: two pore domain potassium channel family protein [Flavobacteriales bacterium]|nr:two pore domain potassium channel family protein [Flavobacteriales bacterium]